jgi:hypothetical protein
MSKAHLTSRSSIIEVISKIEFWFKVPAMRRDFAFKY